MTGSLQRPSGGGGPPVKDVLAGLDRGASELEQAVSLVRASIDDGGSEQLSIGEPDRALLALHRRLLGRDVEVTVACGGCGSQNTFVLNGSTVPPLALRTALRLLRLYVHGKAPLCVIGSLCWPTLQIALLRAIAAVRTVPGFGATV
jgi:hypothetical protein